MVNIVPAKVQEIRTLRSTARALRERATLSIQEADASEAAAQDLEKTLTPEELAVLNPAAK